LARLGALWHGLSPQICVNTGLLIGGDGAPQFWGGGISGWRRVDRCHIHGIDWGLHEGADAGVAWAADDSGSGSLKVGGPMSPSPKAAELMLETMTWVQWLEVEQRHLVWMRADRYEWQQIGKRFACDQNTASRRWQKAIEVVAARLNSHTGTSGQTTPLSGTIRK